MLTLRRILPVFFIVLCCALPSHAAPTLSAMAHQIICDCPDCGKQTVDQCMATCTRGKELAAEISQQIGQGKNENQILDYMSATHGEQALAVPHQNNFLGRMAPLAPFLIMLLGVVPIAYITHTRRKKVKITGPKQASQKTASDDERLTEALKTFDY